MDNTLAFVVEDHRRHQFTSWERLRDADVLRFDGLIFSAEAGSAWTLVYPAYSVVVPEPGRVKAPLAYAMPIGDASMAPFVDTWIDLKQKDGTIAGLFEHWILGRAAEEQRPRWSVIRDVLHWGDPRGGAERSTERH